MRLFAIYFQVHRFRNAELFSFYRLNRRIGRNVLVDLCVWSQFIACSYPCRSVAQLIAANPLRWIATRKEVPCVGVDGTEVASRALSTTT